MWAGEYEFATVASQLRDDKKRLRATEDEIAALPAVARNRQKNKGFGHCKFDIANI